VCDTRNHCVRFIDPAGIIHQFAGTGPYDINAEPTFSGDGGPATLAHLLFPRDVAADTDGNIYIADTGNSVIRMVAPDGTISTVAGQYRPLGSPPLSPTQVIAEDGKAAAKINLTAPYGVEVDWKGRLWIADTDNNVIRILYR
jgi:NHL repeat-containing protein